MPLSRIFCMICPGGNRLYICRPRLKTHTAIRLDFSCNLKYMQFGFFLGETLNGHFYQLTIFEQFSVKTGIRPTISNNFPMHKKGYCIVL